MTKFHQVNSIDDSKLFKKGMNELVNEILLPSYQNSVKCVDWKIKRKILSISKIFDQNDNIIFQKYSEVLEDIVFDII